MKINLFKWENIKRYKKSLNELCQQLPPDSDQSPVASGKKAQMSIRPGRVASVWEF